VLSYLQAMIVGRYGNCSRKFLSGVDLASASVTSFDAIPTVKAMLTFPPTLVPDRDLYEKGKLHTHRISSF